MKTLKIIIRRLAPLILPIVFLFIVSAGWATTRNVTCSGNITLALNTAISSAANGDIVNIGAGSCTLGAITITDKEITIQGQGQGVTNITASSLPIFHLLRNNANNANSRVTGMTMTGTQTSDLGIIHVNGQYGNAGTNDGWRIDHLTLNFPQLAGAAINVDGPTWGLIDNNTITVKGGFLLNLNGVYCSSGTGCEVNQGATITTLAGRYLLSQALEPGSRHAIYVEDNTLTFGDTNSHAVFDTNNVGSRLVFRYNTVTNGIMYAHWTRSGWINGFWFEVYNNKFAHTASDTMFPGRFEGGTGLIYNNTFTGWSDMYIVLNDPRGDQGQSGAPLLLCDGTHNWDGNAGDAFAPGWPCLGQIGRASGKTIAQIQAGSKPASFPFYSWNNGTQDKCYNLSASGSACTNTVNFNSWTANYIKGTRHTVGGGGYGQGDIDFFLY